MRRGTVSIVGVVLLVAITIIAAGAVSVAFAIDQPESPTMASFGLAVDAETDRITLTHRAGDPVDLTETELKIEVDGKSLDSNPPVPFFAAPGFESGPSGPFNTASPNRWRPGETGTITVASTNEPQLQDGSTVTVRVITDGQEIAKLTATA